MITAACGTTVGRNRYWNQSMICLDGSAKVLDFGVACALNLPEFSRITRSGDVPGTAMYTAPEVAAGEPAQPNSDLSRSAP